MSLTIPFALKMQVALQIQEKYMKLLRVPVKWLQKEQSCTYIRTILQELQLVNIWEQLKEELTVLICQ